jgi:hypothetical protein
LSNNQDYFDILFGLLERADESSIEAWSLIQKLVTNPTIYEKLLSLNLKVDQDKNTDWSSLTSNNIFKLLYIFQIMESLINKDNSSEKEIVKMFKGKDSLKDCVFVILLGEQIDTTADVKEPPMKEFTVSELLPKQKKPDEQNDILETWMLRFLKIGGFEYVYSLLLEHQNEIKQMSDFQKHFLSFVLNILTIFMSAAFMAIAPKPAATEDKPEEEKKEEDKNDKEEKKEEKEEKKEDKDDKTEQKEENECTIEQLSAQLDKDFCK